MEIFIARQPIFDKQKKVIAYELLFRSGLVNAFDLRDGTAATIQVMVNSFLHFGIGTLTGGKRAFINITREVLSKEYIHLFPSELVVPEILEDIPPEPDVLEACAKLKKAGFLVALDDFVCLEGYEPLADLADIVKVDFMAADETAQRELARSLGQKKVTLLAEKVETHEDFQRAVEMGYQYFQGYFFAKPEILSERNVPGTKIHYMQLMQKLMSPELEFDGLEEVIKRDISLSFRLLKYVNSAFFGWRTEVRSIHHALVLLGERDIRRWASLVAVTQLGDDKPLELLFTSLVRARFCEGLAQLVKIKYHAQDLFLMGMFSVLDALLDRPHEEVLKDIPLSDNIFGALTGERNLFRDILDLVIFYEQGDWTRMGEITGQFGIEEAQIPGIYFNAVEWAQESLNQTVA